MPKIFSGQQVIKLLCRDFGFCFISQKGSHIKLAKRTGNKKIITIVPNHKELALGTLNGVLRLAQINEKDFRKKAK